MVERRRCGSGREGGLPQWCTARNTHGSFFTVMGFETLALMEASSWVVVGLAA
jgi:hypothetical protein